MCVYVYMHACILKYICACLHKYVLYVCRGEGGEGEGRECIGGTSSGCA